MSWQKLFPHARCAFGLRHAFLAGLLLFVGLREAAHGASTIIVGDGGSVVAAVAAASSGDTIEIRSNQTFVGTLDWFDKFLTIQAGVGFSPVIKGSAGSDAISDAWGYAGSGAGGAIKGVTLQSGGNRAVTLSATADTETIISFDRVTFDGGVLLGGTGSYYTNARFSDCTLLDEFAVGNTGGAYQDILFERNRIAGVFRATCLSESGFNILAVNNLHAKAGPSPFDEGVILGGDGFGQSRPTARFVNSTVVGWDIGLLVADNARASFENMLLANVDDIGVFDGLATIRNSLISDGTFAGVNGNFGGMPMLDAEFKLLPGSTGVDAGNNAAANLPATDIRGFSRILDGNGDGAARVDVGAFEIVPEPGAIGMLALGAIAVFGGRPSRPRRCGSSIRAA